MPVASLNTPVKTKTRDRRSIESLLAPLETIAADSTHLSSNFGATFRQGSDRYELPRYVFLGPRGGTELLRVGIFATLHGDEPEGAHGLIEFVRLLEQSPDLARGFCLLLYPLCNPTGYEDNARHSRGGPDLNTEFWRGSSEPEVLLLQEELLTHQFHGIITLHSDEASEGINGSVHGATLTRHLLDPALQAASEILPLDARDTIDGKNARNGIIHRQAFTGALRAPDHAKPRPFEIALRTPRHAPQYLQRQAFAIALTHILAGYRELIAYAAHL